MDSTAKRPALVIRAGKALSKDGGIPTLGQLGWMVVIDAVDHGDLSVINSFTGEEPADPSWEWVEVSELQGRLGEGLSDQVCEALLVAVAA